MPTNSIDSLSVAWYCMLRVSDLWSSVADSTFGRFTTI